MEHTVARQAPRATHISVRKDPGANPTHARRHPLASRAALGVVLQGAAPNQAPDPHRDVIHNYFFQHLGACRRRTPRACADLKVSQDASRRDLSDATLRLDLGLGVSPSACAEKSPRIDLKSRQE